MSEDVHDPRDHDPRDHDPAEDHLWNGPQHRADGHADPTVARLEHALAPLRAAGDLDQAALPARLSTRRAAAPTKRGTTAARAFVAIGAIAAIAAAIWLFGRPRNETLVAREDVPRAAPGVTAPATPASGRSSELADVEPAVACGSAPAAAGFRFVSIEGAPRCDGAPLAAAGVLSRGAWLETDSATRVRIDVADIGHVEIDHGSRVRLLETGKSGHRLELARGRLLAEIEAPPRVFFVDTKAATAVDLGCAYELTVDDRGAGRLVVKAGYVELEPVVGASAGGGSAAGVWGGPAQRLPSVVPAGAECAIDPALGPGIPVYSLAKEGMRDAVARLDEDAADRAALDAFLESRGPKDTLGLVHLLERVPEETRAVVLDVLESVVKAPPGATRSATLALDPAALSAWRAELAPRWRSRGK